jgi:hypothetical protein
MVKTGSHKKFILDIDEEDADIVVERWLNPEIRLRFHVCFRIQQ